jgi:Glycosyltransferase family 87
MSGAASAPHALPSLPRWRVALGAACLAIALAAHVAFGFLGVGRADKSGGDLVYLHLAGQTWLAGRDAYLPQDRAAVAPDAVTSQVPMFAYPPNVHPVAALLGLFDFDVAVGLVAAANLLLLAAAIVLTLDLVDRHRRDRPAPGLDRRLWVVALVVAMPFAAHVSRMGQTSLLVLAALIGAWQLRHRGPAWALCGLLALAAIKPQMTLLVALAIGLTTPLRRWVGAVPLVLASMVYPAIVSTGPAAMVERWLLQVQAYAQSPLNAPGFQHATGMHSVLSALGLPLPGVIWLVLGAMGAWWVTRQPRWNAAEQLAALSSLAALLLPMHDYDLVVLLVPLLVLGLRAGAAVSHWAPYLFAVTMLYLPQRLIRGQVPDWVLQYRTLLALLLLYLLWRGAEGVGFHRGDT